MTNSVDFDETCYYEPSHLDLCCLHSLLLSPVAAKVNKFEYYILSQVSGIGLCA